MSVHKFAGNSIDHIAFGIVSRGCFVPLQSRDYSLSGGQIEVNKNVQRKRVHLRGREGNGLGLINPLAQCVCNALKLLKSCIVHALSFLGVTRVVACAGGEKPAHAQDCKDGVCPSSAFLAKGEGRSK